MCGGIVSATRQYPLEGVKKDEIDTVLGYFGTNAPRMRHHWFRQCGLFTGSGTIRRAPPDREHRENNLDYLQNWRAPSTRRIAGGLTARRGSVASMIAQPAGPDPEDAEADAALEEYREWSEAGRPGVISHEQARRLLLGEDAAGQVQ